MSVLEEQQLARWSIRQVSRSRKFWNLSLWRNSYIISADVVLFDIHANVMCAVGPDGIICKGGIDAFSLGPLSVRGVNGPRAIFELELTDSKQSGQIDGMVEIYGAQ